MSESTNTQLAPYIERARKVLQYEQRGNHKDQLVKGGLDLVAVRWADEVSTICKGASLDLKPIHRFTEQLEGYRRQDPMQRAASLRAALAILNELDDNEQGNQLIDTARTQNPNDPAPARANQAESRVSQASTRTTPSTKDKTAQPPAHSPQAQSRTTPQKSIRIEAGMSKGHASLTLLSADITAVPGVGPSVAAKLHSLGIRTVRDLLFYFPRQHRDYSKLVKITNIHFGEGTTTLELIWEVVSDRSCQGLAPTCATISDETGKLRVTWFNQPYLQNQLQAAKNSYSVVTAFNTPFWNKTKFNS